MKLLYVSQDKYPVYRADVSILFGKELPKLGMRVDWILQSKDELDRPILKEGNGELVYIGSTCVGDSLISKIKNHWLALKTDLQIFIFSKKNKYDFIQVKDKFLTAIIGLLAAKLYGAKFVYWMSFPIAEAYIYMYQQKTARFPMLYFIRGILSKFILYKIILPMSDHVFVQSEQMKRDVIEEGIDTKKLTPVPMGVDMDSIPYSDSKEVHTTVDNKNNIILYLGALDRNRHIEFLIHVMVIVIKNNPDATLYLIGKGEKPGDEEFILNEAKKKLLVGSVMMTGFLPMNEAWQYVKKADVCVSPFYPAPILNSTSPTKLIEYMAMEKPVVANDHPEQTLVINESHGGLCVPYDVHKFASAINNILENAERGKIMGKKGRRYVKEKRSYEIIAKNVMNKYHDLKNN